MNVLVMNSRISIASLTPINNECPLKLFAMFISVLNAATAILKTALLVSLLFTLSL